MTSDDRRGRKWFVDVAACDANIKNTQQFVCCQSLICMRSDEEEARINLWPVWTSPDHASLSNINIPNICF